MSAPHITFVCTGNAARSVMARAMFAARTDDRYTCSGAGTLVVEGLPMSQRTRTALARLGLEAPDHRSRQLDEAAVDQADLLVVMEPSHVAWMRRRHPEGAARTGTLKRLVRCLPTSDGPLEDRLRMLSLERVEIEPWEEVVDPAAGEQDEFDRCAAELDGLVDGLITALDGSAS